MNIKIHDSTYIFILVAFLSGYFEYIYILLLIIIIHEVGHLIFGYLGGIKHSVIVIYPFGGITKYNNDLNVSIRKELFLLIGGITFQLLFYLLVLFLYNNLLVTAHVFNLFNRINIFLISINFLPIIPLDGGKLINLILDYFFSYRVSNIISIIISIVFIFLFTIINKTYLSLIFSIFLIKSIYLEIINIRVKYYAFLFERYKNNYNFKKSKIIHKYDKFKREYYHYINNTSESVFLLNLFDTKC